MILLLIKAENEVKMSTLKNQGIARYFDTVKNHLFRRSKKVGVLEGFFGNLLEASEGFSLERVLRLLNGSIWPFNFFLGVLYTQDLKRDMGRFRAVLGGLRKIKRFFNNF